MRTVLFVIGLVVVLMTASGVLFVLVLPRRPRGLERLSLLVIALVRRFFVLLSRLVKTYESKDALLSPTGPVCLVVQLASWAGGFILGFSLMLNATTHSFALALEQATMALFTVGSLHVGGTENLTIDIAAGSLWVIVVTLQIAYLPSLYAAFNKREGLVAMLESRSAVPAWGPEILARHQIVGISDTLPELYASWEEWSADLAESHTTYPVLLLFRSPEAWYSWLIGLLAVLDAAAMHLALCPSLASSQARLCLRMGFTALNRIALTLGWTIDPDPNPLGPLALSFEEFDDAVAMLEETGFPTERNARDAWADFVGWRVNYESVAYRLADLIEAPPAPWSGPRRHLGLPTEAPHRPPQRTPRGFSHGGRND